MDSRVDSKSNKANTTMRTRIITGIIGLVVVVLALVFLHTPFFNILVSFFSVVAAYELMKANKTINNRPLMVLNFIFAAALPFATYLLGAVAAATVMAYIIITIGILVFFYKSQNFNRYLIATAEIAFYTFSFYSIVTLRDMYLVSGNAAFVKSDGIYFLLLGMAMAWGADTGAYFVGSFFGKRKMAPHVSEHKTWEGFAGGILSSVILCVLISVFYKIFAKYEIASINYVAIIILAVFGAIVGVIGDLFASCIKRTNEIKDFGNLLPGHGGSLDRFDSFALVAPYLSIAINIIPILQRF